jgi:hypothetical protein
MNSPVFMQGQGRFNRKTWLWITLLLAGVLTVIFLRSFLPGQALFANDGPLGVSVSHVYEMPAGFLGIWNDLHWLGLDSGSFPPNFYGFMRLIFGALGYVNFSPFVSLLICGLCASLYFRQLGMGSMASTLGALAAALNGNFFSNACWGLPSRATGLGMTFLALAALHSSFQGHRIVKTVLAGFAVGMSISESGDNGAIFSLFVAAYGVFLWLNREGPVALNLIKGGAQVAAVAVFAALLAAQTLNIFVGTAVKGIVGTEQDDRTREQKWDFATQWSLPKAESLRVVIPGLFGYRMDTPKGGHYWGGVGQTPGWPEHRQGTPRHSGAGEYAGVLVALVAFWAFVQSLFRGAGGIFTTVQRRTVLFWAAMGGVALLLSWGRHAPFYQFVYALPYFSTIRNPMKFMHPFHLCLMVMFGYGLHGMARRYLATAAGKASGVMARWKAWWPTAQASEKLWTVGALGLLAAGVLGMLLFTASRDGLLKHLTGAGYASVDAAAIARFATGEVGLFVVFLGLSVGALFLVQSGFFAGDRAAWAAVLLGLILVVDLARANRPWIRYYDYRERYASNPVLDILKERPHEGRVALLPFRLGDEFARFQSIYHIEWLQHQFQYYNIQSIDVSQEPRMGADKAAYMQALSTNVVRYWQLSNTRYLFGMAGGFAEALNQQLDPAQRRFRNKASFGVSVAESDGGYLVKAQTNATGPFALIEFTGALPRAKLYSQWQVGTNDPAVLAQLADPAFDPFQTVLVAGDAPTNVVHNATNAAPATVEFASYAPKRIALKTSAATPTVLLLNDRFHPAWKVFVDGAPAPALRCNFLARGVQLPAGQHTVEWRYEPQVTMLWVTTACVATGLLLCGFLCVTGRRTEAEASAPKPASGGKPRPAS